MIEAYLAAVLVPAAVVAVYLARNPDVLKKRVRRLREQLEEEANYRKAYFTSVGAPRNTGFKLYRLGYSISYRHFLVLNGLISILLAVSCIKFLYNIQLGITAAVIWMLFIHKAVDLAYLKEKSRLDEQAELMLQLLSEQYQVTENLISAIENVIPSTRPPLRDELELLIKNYNLSKNRDECLREFAWRTDNRDIEIFVQGIILSDHYGTDTHEVINQTAEIIREKIELRNELQNETKGKSFTVYIFLVGLPLILLLMSIKSPEFRYTFLHTARGHNLLTAALIIEFVSWYFTSRRGVADLI